MACSRDLIAEKIEYNVDRESEPYEYRPSGTTDGTRDDHVSLPLDGILQGNMFESDVSGSTAKRSNAKSLSRSSRINRGHNYGSHVSASSNATSSDNSSFIY